MLWLGADWPIHDLAERYLYIMHMTQHMLFTLVAAPLLIAGMPAWMRRALLAPRPVRRSSGSSRGRWSRCSSSTAFCCSPLARGRGASVGSELAHFSLHVLIGARRS